MFGTVTAVLVCFGWFASGGQLWAQLREAADNPGRFLERMADNGRAGLVALKLAMHLRDECFAREVELPDALRAP
jgi:hypothetical protein